MSRNEKRRMLETALEGFAECVRMREEDEDALFMWAQVGVSLGEMEVEEGGREEGRRRGGEAVGGFERCWVVQMERWEVQGRMEAGGAEGGVPQTEDAEMQIDAPAGKEGEEEFDYAEISPPITPDTLLDTNLALLAAYTFLTTLVTSPEEITVLTSRIDAVISRIPPPHSPETLLTLAKSRLALAEAHFTHLSLPQRGGRECEVFPRCLRVRGEDGDWACEDLRTGKTAVGRLSIGFSFGICKL